MSMLLKYASQLQPTDDSTAARKGTPANSLLSSAIWRLHHVKNPPVRCPHDVIVSELGVGLPPSTTILATALAVNAQFPSGGIGMNLQASPCCSSSGIASRSDAGL